jgi:hypothetical protein
MAVRSDESTRSDVAAADGRSRAAASVSSGERRPRSGKNGRSSVKKMRCDCCADGAAQSNGVAIAAAAAAVALTIVLAVGTVVRAALSRVPENTLKFVVGVMLTTFGTFWARMAASHARGSSTILT